MKIQKKYNSLLYKYLRKKTHYFNPKTCYTKIFPQACITPVSNYQKSLSVIRSIKNVENFR